MPPAVEETRDMCGKVPPDRLIAEIADRQHGVITLSDLRELGVSEDAVHHRVRIGRLHRVHRGVFAVGRGGLTGRGRWMAAVLAYAPDGHLGHRCAASLHALLFYSGRRIVVTSPTGKSRPGIVVHRVRRLPDVDRDIVDNIPVTSIARTLVDIAGIVRRDQLDRAIDVAERRGVLDLRAFEGRKLPRALGDALAGYRDVGFTRSDFERRFARMCIDAGLRPPAMNIWIHGQEVDAVWEEEKVAVQLDTYEFHGTRTSFEDDRRRDAELQVAGYSVLRVTGRRLDDDSAGVAAAVRSFLSASSSATAASTSSPNSSRSAIAS
jgi:hypothetical protein